jgi:hypothetical protein
MQKEDGLRKRKTTDDAKQAVTTDKPDVEDTKKAPKLAPITWSIWIPIVLTLVVSLAIVVIVEDLPPAMTADPTSPFDSTSVSRVRTDMTSITNLGCRTVGSHANEELAVDMITGMLSKIQSKAHESVVFEIAKQSVSGAFNMDFLGGATNVYQDVTNVMCR